MPDVVDEPGDEEDRAAREDAEQLTGHVDCADGDGHADTGEQTERDPDAAERRGRCVVPALTRGMGDEPLADVWRAEEHPEHDSGDGQGGDRDGRAHTERVEVAAERTVSDTA